MCRENTAADVSWCLDWSVHVPSPCVQTHSPSKLTDDNRCRSSYLLALRFSLSWVNPHFSFFFFFIAPLSVWAVAGPGQLCHILSTAGTHFLFPFWINLLTSFTAFTYKNPPTVLPDRCGSNRKDKVRDNGPRADALTSCLFHFLGSFWISSRLYLLGLFVFFLEEYIKRINRLLFYIWHPSTWRCCSWSGSL